MSEVRQYEIPINYDFMPWLAGLTLSPEPWPLVLTRAERKIFKLKKRIPVSEWAERNRVLTTAKSSGPWKNERAPHLAGIMDAAGFPSVQTVILCAGPQTGKSESVHNFVGYCIDLAPGPVLYIYPDERTARENMRDRIQPMVESSPRLRSYLSGRDDDMALLRLNLTHMPIYVAWARSSATLKNRPIKYLIFDETDEYPETSGPKETDPISLGEKRAITYRESKKIFKISTPTTEGNFIWQALTKEAQVIFDYWVRCPECGWDQRMLLENIRVPEDCHDPNVIETKELAWYKCSHCTAKWVDYQRIRAAIMGGWRERVPDDSGRMPLTLKTYLNTYRPKKIGFQLPAWVSIL